MLTKLNLNRVELRAVALLLGSSLTLGTALISCTVHAAPATTNNSPYRLNAEAVKIPQPTDTVIDQGQNHAPQMYQLEYKYRSQTKPPKVKVELTNPTPAAALTPTPQLLSFRIADESSVAKLEEQPFSNEIALAANAASLDPSLVHAVIYVESRYRHGAISPKGAVGLMQVLPDTAARYGLRDSVHLPKGNIKAGTLYLRDLMRMFDNRLDLVLAAYNAGEGAVKKYSRQIPPYPETRLYVKAVMAKYASNAGANQWRAMNNNEDAIQVPASLPAKPRPAKYLAGTDLVIADELFTLNR